MKVITEERLIELLESTSRVTSKDLLRVLIYECTELDTLTVSKLRPMSEVPIIPEGKLQVFVLVYFSHTEIPSITPFDTRYTWPHAAYHGIGWIPMPEGPTKEMIWPTDTWIPIDENTPKNIDILVYAPPYQDLKELQQVCRWHEYAGFCIDELRTPTHYKRLADAPKITRQRSTEEMI